MHEFTPIVDKYSSSNSFSKYAFVNAVFPTFESPNVPNVIIVLFNVSIFVF